MQLPKRQQALLQRIEDELRRLAADEPSGGNRFVMELLELAAARYEPYKEMCECDGSMKTYVARCNRVALIQAIAAGAATADTHTDPRDARFNIEPICEHVDRHLAELRHYGIIPGYPPPTSLWCLVPECIRNCFGRK